jgi:hypothetical protein
VIDLQLTAQQLQDIGEALEDNDIEQRFHHKLLALRMHHEGASHGFIGRCLNISQPTLRTYLLEYQHGGLERVLEDRSYRPSSSLAPFWQCLKCSFAAAPVANAKMAVQRIQQLTGIRLSESQCRRTMKRPETGSAHLGLPVLLKMKVRGAREYRYESGHCLPCSVTRAR